LTASHRRAIVEVVFDKEVIQIILAAFHSEGAELNPAQAELVLRIWVRATRRYLPAETEGLNDMEVLRVYFEACDDDDDFDDE
jgi:hypothetical protein